jgi:hypothetical protein
MATHERIGFAALAIAAALLSSCAQWQELQQIGEPTPEQRAEKLETMLSAAGFNMLAADTPAKQQQVQSLPPRKVSYYVDQKSGKIFYWMADPEFCHCLYHGSDQAYQNYQRIKLQEKFAQKEQQTAQDSLAAAQMEQMDMAYPFGPFWAEPVFVY